MIIEPVDVENILVDCDLDAIASLYEHCLEYRLRQMLLERIRRRRKEDDRTRWIWYAMRPARPSQQELRRK